MRKFNKLKVNAQSKAMALQVGLNRIESFGSSYQSENLARAELENTIVKWQGLASELVKQLSKILRYMNTNKMIKLSLQGLI